MDILTGLSDALNWLIGKLVRIDGLRIRVGPPLRILSQGSHVNPMITFGDDATVGIKVLTVYLENVSEKPVNLGEFLLTCKRAKIELKPDMNSRGRSHLSSLKPGEGEEYDLNHSFVQGFLANRKAAVLTVKDKLGKVAGRAKLSARDLVVRES